MAARHLANWLKPLLDPAPTIRGFPLQTVISSFISGSGGAATQLSFEQESPVTAADHKKAPSGGIAAKAQQAGQGSAGGSGKGSSSAAWAALPKSP